MGFEPRESHSGAPTESFLSHLLPFSPTPLPVSPSLPFSPHPILPPPLSLFFSFSLPTLPPRLQDRLSCKGPWRPASSPPREVAHALSLGVGPVCFSQDPRACSPNPRLTSAPSHLPPHLASAHFTGCPSEPPGSRTALAALHGFEPRGDGSQATVQETMEAGTLRLQCLSADRPL